MRSGRGGLSSIFKSKDDLPIVPEHPGRYQPVDGASDLGRGGIGRVLLVYDRNLDREVALKELLPDQKRAGESNPSLATARFLREAQITGRLEHPSILPVHELGKRADGTLYYTMKLVRGRTLGRALADCLAGKERLQLLPHFVDLCQAVAYAHDRGVVHRDIKPHNVMLGEFGETILLDWGLAKIKGGTELFTPAESAGVIDAPAGDPELTGSGTMLGTPAYMSPEQAAGELDEVDERSDIWSLGAVLYTILTGETLTHTPSAEFEADTVVDAVAQGQWAGAQVKVGVSGELASICQKALNYDKDLRYARAKDLAADVQAFLTGGQVSAYEYATWELVKRFAAKHKLPLLLSSLVAVLLIVAGLAAYLQVARERNLAVAARHFERLRRAESQWEGARAARMSGDMLEARAKLRGSLEAVDSAPGRALWWKMSKLPLVWKKNMGALVFALAYAPDGQQIAVGTVDRAVYIFDAHTRATKKILRGHGDQVRFLAFAPDGKTLASCGWNGEIWLWDLPQGRGRRFPVSEGSGYHLAFSPDGKFLAVSGPGSSAELWQVATGKKTLVLSGHEGEVRSVDFSPNGQWLATGSKDRTVRLWQARTGAWLRTMIGHQHAVRKVAFSPDSSLLLSLSGRASARIWTLNAPGPPRLVPADSTPIQDATFAPDSKVLALADRTGLVHLHSLAEGKTLRSFPHDGPVHALAFSPDSRNLATADAAKVVWVWDLGVESEKRRLIGHQDSVNGIAFSPDGKTLASCSYDQTVRLWEVASSRQDARVHRLAYAGWGLHFSPDGRYLAAGTVNRNIWIWDRYKQQRLAPLAGHDGVVFQVVFSPDGKTLASASSDKTIRLWDIESGRSRHVLLGHTGSVRDVRFSPDGRVLASAGTDRSIRVWEVASGRAIRTLEGHTDEVWGVAFSPDGKMLASSSSDGTVRWWNWRRGNSRLLGWVEGRAYYLDVSPDGRTVGVPSSTGKSYLFDVSQSGAPRVLSGHRGEANFLRFSPDGARLATSSDDGTVRLWNVASAKPYWRAPVMLSVPGRPEKSMQLYSHRGWAELDGSPAGRSLSRSPLPGLGSEDLQEVRLSSTEPQGRFLCLGSYEDEVSLWDRRQQKERFRLSFPGLENVRVRPDGSCVILADARVHLLAADGGKQSLAPRQVTALALAGPEILVAAERQVTVFSAQGVAGRVYQADLGISALTRSRHWLVLGFADGNIELISRETGAVNRDFSFEAIPASPVVSMVTGAMDTLVVGYANGLVGIWSLGTGKRLDYDRLHGAVIHLAWSGPTLYAAGELGGNLVWDLAVFSSDYCQLMREVWNQVPMIWEKGRPVHQPIPRKHACLSPQTP